MAAPDVEGKLPPDQGSGEVTLALPDPLVMDTAPQALERLRELERAQGPAQVDLSAVERVDSFGLAALASGLRQLRADGRRVRVVGLDPALRRRAGLLRMERVLAAPPEEEAESGPGWFEGLLATISGLIDALISILALLWTGLRHAVSDSLRNRISREQLVRQLDQIGAGGTVIVGGVTLLIGSIMAFQTAYVVSYYGGTSFVPRGVTVSLTREIGPLMAAFLVAGRSGSAIAAELGTMAVSEEVDALTMMALDPQRFLLSPRFLALCLAVPALALLADACGVFGAGLVMVGFYDTSWASFWQRAIDGVLTKDVASGLIKSTCFGALIAAVATYQGLYLRGGPEAVGRAATAAVVNGILAVVIFDALFTGLTHKVL